MANQFFDSIGNPIQEGGLLFWTKFGMIAKVSGLNHGGLVIPGKKELTDGVLTLQVEIPLNPKQPKQFLQDFISIHNPAAQLQVAEPAGEPSADPLPPGKPNGIALVGHTEEPEAAEHVPLDNPPA